MPFIAEVSINAILFYEAHAIASSLLTYLKFSSKSHLLPTSIMTILLASAYNLISSYHLFMFVKDSLLEIS